MTIIMSFFGLIVFIISLLTAGFTSAFKRFVAFALTGLAIDMSIIFLAGIAIYGF